MDRRHLLATAALLPLAACAPGQSASSVTPSQVVNDIGLIATGLTGALPALGLAGVSASTVATVGKYVSQISGLASSVSTALSTSAALPVVEQIGSVLQQILTVAGPLLPPPWGAAVMAAEVLLPVIESGVGMLVNAATPAPTAPAPLITMTPDQARQFLASVASK